MINGLCLSEIRSINQTHRTHSRKLKEITHHKYSQISQMDKQLSKIIQNRKYNHDRWKKFKHVQEANQLLKGNDSYNNKLKKIKMSKSIYHYRVNTAFVSSVAHNFYNRKRFQTKIEAQNQQFVKKIQEIRKQSSLSASKAKLGFEKISEIKQRIQKFPVIERLCSFTQQKNLKTEGDSPKNWKIGIRNLSVPRKRTSVPEF